MPGLDSQRAADMLEAAGSQRAGLTAQLVVAGEPSGAELAGIRAGAARLPHVLTTSQSVSPTAGWRSCACSTRRSRSSAPPTSRRSRTFAGRAMRSGLEIETGGDLFFAFEESGGVGELAGIAAAAAILLVAFGSLIAMGLPIGMAVFGLAVGIGAMPLVAHLIDVPIFAPELAAMIGLGVGIDYALFILTRHREHLDDRSERGGGGRPRRGDRGPGRDLRRRDRGDRDPRAGRRRRAVHDRRGASPSRSWC